MTAQEILKLIVTVDPSDASRLDEIDCRVACYLQGFKYGEKITCLMLKPYPFYTRSRDALKAIRPEGYFIREGGHWCSTGEFYFLLYSATGVNQFYTDTAPTEELAELHAIIQAIDYERNK